MLKTERTTISQRKSKTTKAVANRGVDADAPRGENEDQKEKRRKKTSRCIKYMKNGMRHTKLSRRKDVYSEKKNKWLFQKLKKRPFQTLSKWKRTHLKEKRMACETVKISCIRSN